MNFISKIKITALTLIIKIFGCRKLYFVILSEIMTMWSDKMKCLSNNQRFKYITELFYRLVAMFNRPSISALLVI